MRQIAPGERTAFVRDEVDAVFSEWLLQPLRPQVPRNAGWRWFADWAGDARRATADRRVRWPGFSRKRRVGGVWIVPLRTLDAVRAAGCDLRNCMSRADSSQQYRYDALFVMRDNAGRALAMFQADPYREMAEPVQIYGRHNRTVDPKLRAVARDYLRPLLRT